MIEIYFDGLCEPVNPGGMVTFGFVIIQDETQIAEGSGLVGSGEGMTNNVAEYEAILSAIVKFKELGLNESLIIKGDSKLVINQSSGKWKIKSETAKKYVPLIKEALEGYDYQFEWISRDKNTRADELTRKSYFVNGGEEGERIENESE